MVDKFLSHLKFSENKSPHTLSAYQRDLKYYSRYQKQPSKKSFQEYLKGQGLSARSQSRIISALRSFNRFLENQGILVKEKADFQAPLFKKKLPHWVTHQEFEKILEASRDEKSQHITSRNQLLLYLFFNLACRVSELVSLNVSDFIDSDESIVITGKGSKQRILPVTEPLLSHLSQYLAEHRPLFSPKNTHSLLLNHRGKRPSRVDIWRWIRSFCKKTDFLKSPHQFRHGCATELLDRGADLRSIQHLLGHSSIETTKIYTQVTPSKLQNEVQKHHPLSKTKLES